MKKNKFKTIKVYLWGERMKDIYPFASKLEVAKYKTAKFLRKLTQYILLTLVISGISIGLFMYYFPNRVIVSQVTTDNLKPKIAEIQQEAINKLKQCESGGASEDIGLITFDPHATNKSVESASLGSFQYKKSTVIHYYKTLYNKDITGKEAILIALDDDKAEQLTKDIIFTTEKGFSNWILCSNKIKMQETLLVLSKLK